MKVASCCWRVSEEDEEGYLLVDDDRASGLVPSAKVAKVSPQSSKEGRAVLLFHVLPSPMSLQTITPDEGGMSNNLDDLSIFVLDDSGALAASPHPPLAIFLVRLHMPPQVAQS